MSVYKVNSALPVSTKIIDINDMIQETEGRALSGQFNKLEIDAVYSGTGLSRKYIRDYSLGHMRTGSSSWYNFSHVVNGGSGYAIWKFPLYNYEHNTNNLLRYDEKALEYTGEATSETSVTFDSVFIYDGALYTDRTTDAGTKTENDFSVLADTDQYIYIGDDAVFTGITFEFKTFGSGYTLIFEYWNGSEWKTLTSDDNTLVDNTESFIMDGIVTFASVGNWATTAVDGTTRYWVRVSTSATPTVIATTYSILPGRAVPELLALSNSEVQDENWKWCYYETVSGTGSAYVTVRNDGATAYEGDYYVTSSSSDANKENFFYANHTYSIDHEDIQYDESSQPLFTFDYTDHDGRIQIGKIVSISGCGIRPASALSPHTFAFGISRTAPTSGANCKVQQYGVVNSVYTEKSGSGVTCGNRLFLGTGSGQISNTPPTANGQISQLIGVAKSDEVSATTAEGRVDVALHISIDYTEF